MVVLYPLDLKSGKHYPFTKEGNTPLYVHKQSNHPPSILKNIPESINKRLSEISSDKECFDKSKHLYQDALNKSGYKYDLSYNETPHATPRTRRNRQRNKTWFNPPYTCSKNVKTNVGKRVLSLIDHHFPKSSYPLHKIFNRNTLKVSYSCMNNIKTTISSHNKAEISKLSKPPEEGKSNCNCWNKHSCPMDGNCNKSNIIYQAEVTTSQSRETYIGLCDTTFKLHCTIQKSCVLFQKRTRQKRNWTQQIYMESKGPENRLWHQMTKSEAHKIIFKH